VRLLREQIIQTNETTMPGFSKDNIAMLGILAVLMAVAAGVMYWPQSRTLNELRMEIEKEKTVTDAYAAKVAVVPDLRRQVDEMKLRYKDLDRRLPKQKELHGFLKEISENLEKEKLSSPFIEPGNTAREDTFHTLPIIMRFQGNYLSLASFLKRIDTMERLTRVQKLTITTDPKNPDAKINCELRLNIYFTES